MKGIAFDALVDLFPGLGGWHYVPVPTEVRDAIGGHTTRGLIPVRAAIGTTAWDTSLQPMGDGSHFIALKAAVRRAEGITVGDRVTVTVSRR
ncbi:DUF1905 domain-containing protein [Rhodococcus daqingensis]|uniref:DUF1905 domain-containing protein n=1 Tax=Rhodococcus daqingensis TaxID=2479363 RepID=A0ABW2S4U2_9NOCA